MIPVWTPLIVDVQGYVERCARVHRGPPSGRYEDEKKEAHGLMCGESSQPSPTQKGEGDASMCVDVGSVPRVGEGTHVCVSE